MYLEIGYFLKIFRDIFDEDLQKIKSYLYKKYRDKNELEIRKNVFFFSRNKLKS